MEESSFQTVSKDVGGGKHIDSNSSIPSSPFANIKRELTEDELSNPAVIRFLISDHDRMENELFRMRKYEELFHSKDKDCAVLSERVKASTASDVIYTVCETGVSALMGTSALFWEQGGWIILLVGGIFVIGGIIYKFFVR